MDFIKRNLGLLALLVVGLVLAIVLIVRVVHERGVVERWRRKVLEQQDHIKRISEQKLALTSQNLEAARKNHEFAQKQYEQLRTELWKRFSIPRETMAPINCLKKLQHECGVMRKRLEEKHILVGQACLYFSFDQHAQSPRLPSPDEVPILLKQLHVIEEIVELVRNSSVMQLQSIRRLTGTTMLEKDTYTAMPLEVVVVGELPTIQRFVNMLQTKSRYYFMLKYLKLDRVEKNATGLPSLPSSGTGGAAAAGAAGAGGQERMMGMGAGGPAGLAGGAGEGGMMMQPGAMMGGGPGEPGGPQAPGPEAMMRGNMPPGVGVGPMGVAPGMVKGRPGVPGRMTAGALKPTRKESREERLVFRGPSPVTASVRFDFIEFPQPEDSGE